MLFAPPPEPLGAREGCEKLHEPGDEPEGNEQTERRADEPVLPPVRPVRKEAADERDHANQPERLKDKVDAGALARVIGTHDLLAVVPTHGSSTPSPRTVGSRDPPILTLWLPVVLAVLLAAVGMYLCALSSCYKRRPMTFCEVEVVNRLNRPVSEAGCPEPSVRI